MKCTLGGTFLNVSLELEVGAHSPLGTSPAFVVIAVGTTDTGRHMVIKREEKKFRALLSYTIKHFLIDKVRK